MARRRQANGHRAGGAVVLDALDQAHEASLVDALGAKTDQDFNSLDAQRAAAVAYIQSQAHDGWHCLPTRYDDGGFSGRNLDRPALARLLTDIAQGRGWHTCPSKALPAGAIERFIIEQI